MESQKFKETLQTLKELLDDEDIPFTEQDFEHAKREAYLSYVNRQTEGEGGDRGQAPDAVVGTSSGRGREVSGQGSDTHLVATAATSSAPRGSEGVAADRSGAGPKASEARHDDDDVGRRRVEVWRLPKTINPGGVKAMFRGVGTVTEAVVHTQGGSPKARATVTFADSSQAERAVRTMHGKLIEGIGNIGVKMLAPENGGVRRSPSPPKKPSGRSPTKERDSYAPAGPPSRNDSRYDWGGYSWYDYDPRDPRSDSRDPRRDLRFSRDPRYDWRKDSRYR